VVDLKREDLDVVNSAREKEAEKTKKQNAAT
jgi:hypothetical protein